MKLIAFRLIALSLPVIAALVLFEIVLRLWPSLISVPVLAHFESDLRSRIADELGLPSFARMTKIASADRSDRGPTFYHPAPSSIYYKPLDPADAAYGALDKVEMDGKGFCNPPEKSSAERADIVVLGDSFTFCTAVSPKDTASEMLGVMTGASTYNLGIPGIGPYEYLELLRKHGLSLKPRLVIMNVYEGNDLRDLVRFKDFTEAGGEDRRSESSGLLNWSYSLAFIVAGSELLWEKIGEQFGPAAVNFRYSAVVQEQRLAMNVGNADESEVRFGSKVAAGELSVGMFEEPLRNFAALAERGNFVPLVTYIPSMYTAYDETVEFEDAQTAAAVRALSKAQREWLAANAARLRLNFIDLTPAMQAAARTGPLTHFPANVHLTPAGHRVIAGAIADKIGRLRQSGGPDGQPLTLR